MVKDEVLRGRLKEVQKELKDKNSKKSSLTPILTQFRFK